MPAPSARPQRVVIEACRPLVDGGRFAAKAAVGVALQLGADVFADGHDRLLVWARWGAEGPAPAAGRLPRGWREMRLEPGNEDRWSGWMTPDQAGRLTYQIVAVIDDYGTWLHAAPIRLRAGDDMEVEFEEAALMAAARAQRADVSGRDRQSLQRLAGELRAHTPPERRLRLAERSTTVALMERTADREAAALAGPFPVLVDPLLGAFSAWYEFFPRSVTDDARHSGTLTAAAGRLAAIAEMGFDIAYLPPIHPIGLTARKGANNSLDCGPDDPGSPWAIGGPTGGHTALHPDLGTMADFDAFVAEADRVGVRVALDFAAQCSPDHPWVTEHPGWFRHRPDGSIRFAENPPKKYQDIFPLDFECEDHQALWQALLDAMLHWADHGIRVFRVDNPHTKPFAFWEWALAEVNRRYPGTIFLAEAFTRPRVMHRLAKLGFTQSYTYFTWRTAKWELAAYLNELAAPTAVDYFRPNFWPNTPDILHAALQTGGPAMFRLRLVLAALGSPNWGMYSGYELFEGTPIRSGSEEYMNSEKYQLRPRDYDRADSLAPTVGLINQIRRRHRDTITQLGSTRVHHIDNDQLICWSRRSADGGEILMVIVNLDPVWAQSGTTWFDLEALGIEPDAALIAHDELTDTTYRWQGAANYVRLDPTIQPAHIIHLRSA